EVVGVGALAERGTEVGQGAEGEHEAELLLDLSHDVDLELARYQVPTDTDVEPARLDLLDERPALDEDVPVGAHHPDVGSAVPIAVAVHLPAGLTLPRWPPL